MAEKDTEQRLSEESGSTVVDPVEKTVEEVDKHEAAAAAAAAASSSSSSSSDSDSEKPVAPAPAKEQVRRLFGREKSVHQVFGGGKPADVFLWRNKHAATSALIGATVIYVIFEMLEYHLLTLLCHILILVLSVLFLWSNVTAFIYKSAPQVPDLHLPEKPFREFVSTVAVNINQLSSLLRNIASGRDLKQFLIVVASLWVTSVVGKWFNFLTLFYTAFILPCTVPVLYEKYEDKVDSCAEKAVAEMKRQYAVFDARVLSKIPRGPLKHKKQ